MKGLLAVLGRELTEWRLLFLVALITGLIPLAAPWLPAPGGLDPGEIRDGAAVALALLLSAVLSFMLGSSVLARDLSERRLGFYFARPLSGVAIWAGKMLGALILVVGAGLLVLLPTLLARRGFDVAGGWGVSYPAGHLAALLALVLGVLLLLSTSHAVAVMVRSRSPWLVLDAAALAAVAVTFWACRRTLLEEAAIGALDWLQNLGIGVVLGAVSVAGLVQVARGRTDLRRGHRLLSLTLWSLLGALALGSILYTRWVLAATPRDLESLHTVLPAPTGSWIAVGGPTKGRRGFAPTFLFDLASGRFFRTTGRVDPFGQLPAFSKDGSRAVWLTGSASEGAVLWSLDLRRSDAVPVRTTVSYPHRPYFLLLSPDGSRVAARWYDRVTVDDLETGRLLASVSLSPDAERRDELRFPERGRLRIYASSQVEGPGRTPVWRLRIMDLDLATRRMNPVTQVEAPGDEGYWSLSPDGTRALLRRSRFRDLLLVDLRTGRTAALPLKDPLEGMFLADGRLLLTDEDGSRITLRFLSPEGREQLRVRLPGYQVVIGGQPAPDLLAVATRPIGSGKPGTWTSRLIDLRTGRVRKLGRGLLPTTRGLREPGSLPSRLFHRGHGDLLLLDPATGKLRTVLPGSGAD